MYGNTSTALSGYTLIPTSSLTGTSSAVGASSSAGGLSSLLSSLLGAGVSAYGSSAASGAVQQANQNAIATQQQYLGNVNSIYGTQQSTGNSAMSSLASVLGLNGQTANYSDFENSPGYQFAVQQGTQAIQRAAAANGSAYTPNTLDAVGQYVTGTAAQNYNNYVSQLMSTAGLGSSANSALASANLSTGNNISTLQQNIGNAQASGTTGITGSVGSLLSGANGSGLISSIGGLLGLTGTGGAAAGTASAVGSAGQYLNGLLGGTGTAGSMSNTQLDNLLGLGSGSSTGALSLGGGGLSDSDISDLYDYTSGTATTQPVSYDDSGTYDDSYYTGD